ncbi:restriction endonuclease subunit S [Thermococcus sp. GR6]|uniref:restriction endonuclease subunit S n=1 Tax=Thermococcus sp. GR6 TaxID=1638256 RepID=UPI00142F70ED|nr:restriction endonuclease subunit S [Thermococcus sp. GR6]NJE42038.1 restriction endonuclease subunit S [Thermococcus sp. GR6]
MQAKITLKKTPIGEIPEDWEVVKLGDILEEVNLRAKSMEHFDNIPILSLTKNEGLILQKYRFNKKIATGDLSKYKIVKRGWVVYNPYVIWEGAIHVLGKFDIGLVSPVYLVWKPKEAVDATFLDYLLRTKRMLYEYFRLSEGVVQRRRSIKKYRFKDILIPLPPLPEQKKIAEILRTVDKAIEKTDEAIEKTERLKKGLMQRLLTRGIKHKRFKKTELGEIPEEWRVVGLGEIADLRSGGTPSRKKPEYWENGTIPWVKSGELNDGTIYETEEKITEIAVKESSVKMFPKGTLLIALYGATVGKTAILGINATTNQAICAILPKGELFDPSFLQYCIIHSRNRLISQSSGGAQPNIYLYVLKEFKIPLPPLEEQKQIAKILSTIDRRLELLRKRRERLEKVKRGLMRDLLTGRRRTVF